MPVHDPISFIAALEALRDPHSNLPSWRPCGAGMVSYLTQDLRPGLSSAAPPGLGFGGARRVASVNWATVGQTAGPLRLRSGQALDFARSFAGRE